MNPFAIAVQGLGFGPALVAVHGLLAVGGGVAQPVGTAGSGAHGGNARTRHFPVQEAGRKRRRRRADEDLLLAIL